MKLTKENIYINLQGKSEEELKDLYDFLISNNEDVYIGFSDLRNNNYWKRLEFWKNTWTLSISKENKTEVKIQELKQILKPMETFTPIAMKCNKEQFEAVKPKLKDEEIHSVTSFDSYPYLINTDSSYKRISNVNDMLLKHGNYKIYETWNEEIFLKACGIEVDSLEQQLQKAEAEVKRLQSLIEEENKPKNGDVCVMDNGNFKFITIFNNHEDVMDSLKIKKMKDQELINKLNELIK